MIPFDFLIYFQFLLEESRVSLPKQLDAKNIDIKILLIDWKKLSQYIGHNIRCLKLRAIS